jgi:hypothetical protein
MAMHAYEFLERGESLAVDQAPGLNIRVLDGRVWLTGHKDAEDHLLGHGAAVAIEGEGSAVVTAFERTRLELYRSNRVAMRHAIERDARRERNDSIWAFLRRLVERPASPGARRDATRLRG